MPYSKDNIPNSIKELPSKAQDIFISAFNSAFEQYNDEEKATVTAWTAVKKVFKKKDGNWIKGCENYNYLISLSDNSNDNKLVEIMRTGEWKHPTYGELKITDETLENIIYNFNDKVRGIDIPIDLEHEVSQHKGEAAGWIKNLIKKGNKLLAEIEWTKLGEEKIKDKIYKYFSPEFKFNYTDNETGKVYKDVLFGGGLTNKPFIKRMNPVMLSENITTDFCEYTQTIKKEDGFIMNKELLKVLKLSESTSNEEMIKTINELMLTSEKVTELTKSLNDMTNANKELKESNESLMGDNEELKKQLSETTENKSTVEENNIKLSEKIKDIESKLLSAEWDKVSSVALSEGKLTQKMLPVYEKSFKANPEATKDMMKVLEPVVNLSENGSSKSNDDKSNTDLFNDEVTKYMSENKVDYNQAILEVEKNNPQLFRLFDNERRGV